MAKVGIEKAVAMVDDLAEIAAGVIQIAATNFNPGSIAVIFSLLDEAMDVIKNSRAVVQEINDLDPEEAQILGKAAFQSLHKILGAAK